MNERQKINFERIANGEPLLSPVNQQEIMQVKLNDRINESYKITNPLLTITFINQSSLGCRFRNIISIENNIIKSESKTIQQHDHNVHVIETLVLLDEEGDYCYVIPTVYSDFHRIGTNPVNAEFEDDDTYIYVVDPTKPASIEILVYEDEEDEEDK